MKKEQRTGAQALVESLEKAGTEVLFGYPGGQVLDIFNYLPESRMHFVLGRHEQGSTHMADGYARATGRPGAIRLPACWDRSVPASATGLPYGFGWPARSSSWPHRAAGRPS